MFGIAAASAEFNEHLGALQAIGHEYTELNNMFRDCPGHISCLRFNSAVLKTQCRVLIKLPMKTVSQLEILDRVSWPLLPLTLRHVQSVLAPEQALRFPNFLARVQPSQRRHRQYHDQGSETVRGCWDVQQIWACRRFTGSWHIMGPGHSGVPYALVDDSHSEVAKGHDCGCCSWYIGKA